jgi:glycosyltransferase involved in cell wall biosynthesis
MNKLKVALIHDWLTGMRGGEKVLESLCELFPEADIYTLLRVKGSVSKTIESHNIHTSFLQNFPLVEKKYRYYLPLMPKAIESFNLKGYDLIISSSHCVAKGIRNEARAAHFCYCYTPMRYIWDQYDEYFNKKRSGALTSRAMAVIRPQLQKWDVETARRVDHFIGISNCVRERIERIYKRDAAVIYPPVDVERFSNRGTADYYLMVTALVPYKRVDLAIKAFNKLGKKLKIVGSGPDMARLKGLAGKTIELLGWQGDEKIAEYFGNCKAFIFPQEEDFGITAVEAQAAGKPVIAFARGGGLETVIEGKTGTFFNEPTEESLAEAVLRLDGMVFDPVNLMENAKRFSKEKFKAGLTKFLNERLRGKI